MLKRENQVVILGVNALAQDLQNGIVVTQEKLSRNKDKPKIPNVCSELGIECVNPNRIVQKRRLDFLIPILIFLPIQKFDLLKLRIYSII